jgi:hypothetical protein
VAAVCTFTSGCGQHANSADQPSGGSASAAAENADAAAGEQAGAASDTAQNAAPRGQGNESGSESIIAAKGTIDDTAGAAPAVQTVAAETDAAAAGSEPAKPDAVPEHREFRKEGPGGALRITYDDLDIEKLLHVKKVPADVLEKLPHWLTDLRGKRVRLRGFMLPTSVFNQTGNSSFVLTRDTGVCCFGPNPTVYYLVMVKMKPGETTDYIDNRPFDVVGTFDIKPVRLEETGEDLELYQLRDAAVISK